MFRLSDFEGDSTSGSTSSENINVKSRIDLKEHKLERTRGCNMYSISRPGGSHLRMVSIFQFKK